VILAATWDTGGLGRSGQEVLGAATTLATALGETVTPWLVLGGALVVGGIAAAQGVSLPRRRAKRRASFGNEGADEYEVAGT